MATDTKPEAPAAAPAAPAERQTSSEIPIRRFYRPRDVAGVPYAEKVGDPGEFPYTRGLYADMYRKRHWTMRQYAGFSSAAESNQRYRYLLSQGTTGLSVAFDLPTQIGYDSDSPLALGEVGRVGVAIDSLDDMRLLFDAIPLDRVTTSMTINATAAILLALYLAVAEEQGVAWEKVGGTVQNDILKEYAARGTYIYPPRPSLRLAADLVAWCASEAPRFNAISLSGYHMREAGSTAVQEMAFALANAIAYVEAVLAHGVAVDDFAPRLSWIFNTHTDFFEEIAKYRALRRMWATLMRDRFGARADARGAVAEMCRPLAPTLALGLADRAKRGVVEHAVRGGPTRDRGRAAVVGEERGREPIDHGPTPRVLRLVVDHPRLRRRRGRDGDVEALARVSEIEIELVPEQPTRRRVR